MDDALTPAEMAFFETGELPPELAQPDIAAPPPSAPPLDPGPDPAALAPTPDAPPASATPTAPAATVSDALQRQLLEAETRRVAAETRLNDLLAQLQGLQEAAPAAPDPTTDPFGHLQHQIAQVQATLQGLQSQSAQLEAQQIQHAQIQGLVGQARSARDAFMKTTPDFKDAYEHIRNIRASDLRDAGVPEHLIPVALLQDEIALTQQAVAAGKNPAAVLYDIAKRHGYAAKPAAPAASSPAARIEALKAGVAAAKDVPRTGMGDLHITPETLKNASPSDLDKLVQSDELWQKVVGGGRSNDIF